MCNSGFCAPSFPRQRGISLIELIMFIVIVSSAMAGILVVMNQVTSHSADPLIQKQALAIAESMLEEIQLKDLAGACTGGLGVDAPRVGAGCVSDYNGYSTTNGPLTGILDFATNAPVPGLGGYDIAAVVVTPLGTFGGTAINPLVGTAVQIVVTVTDPHGDATTVTGYRAGQ